MKWNRLDVTNCLYCSGASAQEVSDAVQKTGAFLSGCKSKYPHVSRDLEEGITEFIRRLRGGVANPFLKLNAIKLLLRWCITPGKHLQDFRRDNARALWRVLFRGPFPDFYRYRPQTCDYIEDIPGRERWIQSQVGNYEPKLADDASSSLSLES